MELTLDLIKTSVADAFRQNQVRRITYSTKEVMAMFSYTDWGSFMDYADSPECLLKKVKGRRGQWTALSVKAEEQRINQ